MYPSPNCAARNTIPIRMNVSVNCPSIHCAAAAAPAGSHQVLATKKYVLIRVISQIKTINARPIPQPSRTLRTTQKDFPTAAACIPTLQATVGGECNTSATEKSKRENPPEPDISCGMQRRGELRVSIVILLFQGCQANVRCIGNKHR